MCVYVYVCVCVQYKGREGITHHISGILSLSPLSSLSTRLTACAISSNRIRGASFLAAPCQNANAFMSRISDTPSTALAVPSAIRFHVSAVPTLTPSGSCAFTVLILSASSAPVKLRRYSVSEPTVTAYRVPGYEDATAMTAARSRLKDASTSGLWLEEGGEVSLGCW